MSRQATKHDLEWAVEQLGVSFKDRPTVTELRKCLVEEFGKLHSALVVLGYGEPGLGTHANQKRLKALYAAAKKERDSHA